MEVNSIQRYLQDLTKFQSLRLFAKLRVRSLNHELIMELVKLGTKDFMFLEDEEQLARTLNI